MSDTARNPFPVYEYEPRPGTTGAILGWRWLDETGNESAELYPSQEKALCELLRYIHWLNHGPTWVQSIWWPVRYKLWPLLVKFWKDECA